MEHPHEPFPETFKDFICQEWRVISESIPVTQPNGESYFTRVSQLISSPHLHSQQRESVILGWIAQQEKHE